MLAMLNESTVLKDETDPAENLLLQNKPDLWMYRKPVSIAHFKQALWRYLNDNPSRKNDCPVLQLIMEQVLWSDFSIMKKNEIKTLFWRLSKEFSLKLSNIKIYLPAYFYQDCSLKFKIWKVTLIQWKFCIYVYSRNGIIACFDTKIRFVSLCCKSLSCIRLKYSFTCS